MARQPAMRFDPCAISVFPILCEVLIPLSNFLLASTISASARYSCSHQHASVLPQALLSYLPNLLASLAFLDLCYLVIRIALPSQFTQQRWARKTTRRASSGWTKRRLLRPLDDFDDMLTEFKIVTLHPRALHPAAAETSCCMCHAN